MKTKIYYGLQRRTIKEMTLRLPFLRQEIESAKVMAKEHAASISKVCEMSKGPAITIQITI